MKRFGTLRFVAFGTFETGRYIRFPQGAKFQDFPGVQFTSRTLFILYPDGSAGRAVDGKLAEGFPANSQMASKIKSLFKRFDSLPK